MTKRIAVRMDVFFLVSVIFIAGCGGNSKPATYYVKGKVSGAKESLAGVVIQFSPLDSSKNAFSSGKIAQDGSYELTTLDGRRGAEIGKYKVVLTLGAEGMRSAMTKGPKMVKDTGTQAGGPQMPTGMPNANSSKRTLVPQFEYPFPDTYASAATSPKEVEVKSGTNVIDITLQ